MRKIFFLLVILGCTLQMSAQNLLLQTLKSEADRNLAELKKQPVPAYYISYRVYDQSGHGITASFGNILQSTPYSQRIFNAAVRVGSPEMDNTREIKEGSEPGYSNYNSSGYGSLGLENNPESWKITLWQKTDAMYVEATKRYEKVRANVAIKVSSEDKSPDFSEEIRERYVEKLLNFSDLKFDSKLWEEKLKKYSAIFNENKDCPCVGVIFYIDNAITPVVWIRDVDTIYWEQSCASGSMAFSAWRGNGEYKILQPSQDFLKVKVENNVCEISGKVEEVL